MNVFVLSVVFLGGVITGAMLIFFARGPLVAYFRLADESDHEPAPVASAEILGPARVRARRRSAGATRWQRMRPGRQPAALPVQTRPELTGGARWRRVPPWDRVAGDTDSRGRGA